MSILIAKIKREFKNVLNQENSIVDDFDITTIEAIDFTPSHKLDEDEWFKIDNFSTTDYFIEECGAAYSTVNLNQIGNVDYKNINCIAIFQNGKKFFQRITPSLFVNRKTILDYSGEPRIIEHRNQIEIKKESDAIYIVESDTFYFKHIGKIKSIFIGIEELHREATQDEVDEFVNNDFIELSNISSNTIGAQNRKRIADIGAKYNRLSQDKKERLIQYAREKADVDIENESFVVKSETDLKKVLYAMDQRYYFADIYEENRVASSVRVIQQ